MSSAKYSERIIWSDYMTQCERILRHLRDFETITHSIAKNKYGIMRLASRINDLRKMGFVIKTEFAKGKNRYGEPTKWAVYRLETKEKKI